MDGPVPDLHDDGALLELLHAAVDAVAETLSDHDDWGPSGDRAGQYASDLAADRAALEVLHGRGIRTLSEESGLSPGSGPVAVLDPLDGSTNAERALPWYATSICVVDEEGPRVAVVHDHPAEVRFDAVRGGGARRDGEPLPERRGAPDDGEPLPERRGAPDDGEPGGRGGQGGPGGLETAIVAVNGLPPVHPGWAQFRCMGAAALDLCAVAEGRFDAYVDYDHHGPWDYLGGLLVCREVGLEVIDGDGRELVTLDADARRSPIAGPAPLVARLAASRARARSQSRTESRADTP